MLAAMDADHSQAEVLALLADPATHGGAMPQRLDTHISAVFLAGERVYKLKKAVKLPFLDFSTLELRRQACQAEVEVNRLAAAALYLGVTAVTRRPDGGLSLGGAGQAVEYVVAMRRFPEDTLFDGLAARGEIDRRLIQRVIEAVVALHRAAPVRREPQHGGAAGMTWTIDTNLRSMTLYPDILPADRVAELEAGSRAWVARLAPLLDGRRERGLVRRCHGDLHLGNICLLEGRPMPFDAIEFSDDIACVDVFYDLAFLLMDLDVRASRSLAGAAMNHALDLTGDYQAMAALPLFLSLRAGVRALVAAVTAATAIPEVRAAKTAEANAYLDAALAYLSPPAPRLLAVGGLSGSGKSRMGRELAPLLGVPAAAVVRTDALRKQLMGVPLNQRLGPEGYTPEVTERTYQALYDTCAQVLAAGHAVAADAVFARPDQRAAIAQVARAAGVRFDGLWLEVPPAVAAERIQGRTANASDATVAVLERQLDYELGEITWRRIDTSGPKDAALSLGRAAIGV